MGHMQIEVVGDSEFCKSQALEGFEGLSGVLALAAKQLAPIYKAEVRKYNDDLEELGRLAVRKAFKLASKDAKPAEPAEKSGKKSEMPDWLGDFVDPLVGPIMKGAADESAKIWVPLAIGSLVFIVAVPTFFFWLGRKSKRS